MKANQIITAILDENDKIFVVHFNEHNAICDNVKGTRRRLIESSLEDAVYYGLKYTVTDRVDWLHKTFEDATYHLNVLESSAYVVIGLTNIVDLTQR